MLTPFINFCVIAASIILIIILTIMGIVTYRNNNASVVYPPVVSNCPDYWYESYDKNSPDVDPTKTPTGTCYNKMNLGNSKCSKNMDFSKWVGTNGLCKKQTWARKCDITWDGVTNAKYACTNSTM